MHRKNCWQDVAARSAPLICFIFLPRSCLYPIPIAYSQTAAATLRDAEARGWGIVIPSVLASVASGSTPPDWQLGGSDRGNKRRAVLQQAATGPLITQWRRASPTPSLDAWRLGQPAAPGSLCVKQLCSALLAAGVDVDPSVPIAIDPDPSSDLTALRASAQLQEQRAAETAAAAAVQQKRVGTIAGAVVGGFVGLVGLLALAPCVWRRAVAARHGRQQAAQQPAPRGGAMAAPMPECVAPAKQVKFMADGQASPSDSGSGSAIHAVLVPSGLGAGQH